MKTTEPKLEKSCLVPFSAPLKFFGWFKKNTMSPVTSWQAVARKIAGTSTLIIKPFGFCAEFVKLQSTPRSINEQKTVYYAGSLSNASPISGRPMIIEMPL